MFEFTSVEPEASKESNRFGDFESLSVRHLVFGFPGRSQILKDVSFDVNKGEIIAIMGENGSGKTTLTQILQKNYSPAAGQLSINNVLELNSASLTQWREVVGIVPQEIHIFNGTIFENIAFEDARPNSSKVFQFIKQFGFSSFVDGLPQSYQTIVGEEGINLSGGQKQMIALARALYHKPKLLILDEATASLDRASEQFVLNLLAKLKNDLAIIFITHRLHVLKSLCDRIYIL